MRALIDAAGDRGVRRQPAARWLGPLSRSSRVIPPDCSSTHCRRSRIRSRGDSGAPAVRAGQTSWQRPHLVQASRSSSSFQVKSLDLGVAGVPGLGRRSGQRAAWPCGRGRAGSRRRPACAWPSSTGCRRRSPARAAACTHHTTVCVLAAAAGVMPSPRKRSRDEPAERANTVNQGSRWLRMRNPSAGGRSPGSPAAAPRNSQSPATSRPRRVAALGLSARV